MSKINRKHIVKRTVFEVEVERREDADNAQSNFSRIFNSRLIRIMDNVLSEFSDDKVQHRLKYLEINLGTIDNRFFDREVEERFETELRQQLKEIIKLEQVRYPTQTVKLEKETVEKSDLEVVLFFLETGRIPSGFPISGPSVEVLLRNLIAQKSPSLKKALERTTKRPGVLKRITQQFKKDTVTQLIQFVVPRSASFIGKETRALERQFNKATPVAGLPPSKFSKILRASVLEYLFLERRVSFSKKAFLKSLDRQIEIRTGIDKETLLQSSKEKQEEKKEKRLKEFSKSETTKLDAIILLITDRNAEIPTDKEITNEMIRILRSAGWKLKSRLEELNADWTAVIKRLKEIIPEEEVKAVEEFVEFIVDLEPESKQEELAEKLLPILDKTEAEIEKFKKEKIRIDQATTDDTETDEQDTEETQNNSEQDLDLLFYLFKEAKTPWWAPEQTESFNIIFARAIKTSPTELKKVWNTAIQQATPTVKQEVAQFIRKELNKITIEDFLEVIEPDFIGFIITQALALEKITEVRDSITPILIYLMNKGTQPISLPQFIRKTIQIVSNQIQRPEKELAAEILGKIKLSIEQGQPRFAPLENIMRTIDFSVDIPDQTDPKESTPESGTQDSPANQAEIDQQKAVNQQKDQEQIDQEQQSDRSQQKENQQEGGQQEGDQQTEDQQETGDQKTSKQQKTEDEQTDKKSTTGKQLSPDQEDIASSDSTIDGEAEALSVFERLLSKSFSKPEELTIEEVLLVLDYYFEKGALPPAIANFSVKQLEQLIEIGLTEKPLSTRDILVKHFIKKQVRRTTAKTFATPILLRFIARIQPVNKPFYAFAELMLSVAAKVKSSLIDESIKTFLLFYAVTANEPFEPEKTYRILLKHIAREQSILLKEVAEQLKASFKKVSGKSTTATSSTKKKKDAEPTNLTETLQRLTDVLIIEYKRKPQRKFNPKTKEEIEKFRQENIKDNEPIFIENAGIILLYPIMRIAFKMLGYLTPLKTFKDVHSAFRAIHFLQYTATKQYKNVPEYSLALNKLLCGVPFGAPLETDIELTDKEKEMADELIRQLIMKWPMVKNSSVEGFRNSFLIRDGSLVKRGAVWVLNVNKESFDIVLQSYPWGLSLIKFQWMKEYSLTTEWGNTLF